MKTLNNLPKKFCEFPPRVFARKKAARKLIDEIDRRSYGIVLWEIFELGLKNPYGNIGKISYVTNLFFLFEKLALTYK